METSIAPEPPASPAQPELSLFARMFLAQIFSLAGVVVILYVQVVRYLLTRIHPVSNVILVSYVHIASEDILIAALILGLALICIQYAVLAKLITHQFLWLLLSASLAIVLVWGLLHIMFSQGLIPTKVIYCSNLSVKWVDRSLFYEPFNNLPCGLAGLLGAAVGLILGASQACFLREQRKQWCLLSLFNMGIATNIGLFIWTAFLVYPITACMR